MTGVVGGAVARVFGRYGEKANRSRARLKFLIKQLGFDAVAYGVNLDDTGDFRPGHRAADGTGARGAGTGGRAEPCGCSHAADQRGPGAPCGDGGPA